MYNMAETSCSSSSCSDLSLCESSTDTSIDSSFIDTATAAYAHEPEYTSSKQLQKLLPTQDTRILPQILPWACLLIKLVKKAWAICAGVTYLRVRKKCKKKEYHWQLIFDENVSSLEIINISKWYLSKYKYK